MGSKSRSLSDLYLHQLRDLQYAEKHGAKMLSKLARAATRDEVKTRLEALAQQGHATVDQLDTILDQLDRKSQTVPCEAMQGIIDEAKELLHDFADSEALDHGLVAAGQAIVAYGIGRCHALRSWSRRLARPEEGDIELLLVQKRNAMETLDRLADSTPSPAGVEVDPLTPKMAALTGLS
jgi:ferritin-like metal-binding protein YciE